MIAKRSFLWLIPLLPFLFWLIDLGNVEAIRQGTEGFYLQISKEMYQLDSWLVPMYLKQPHWSKPPLHFWFPQPFFIISNGASLFLSRLSVVVVTFALTLLIDRWARRHLAFKKFVFFFVMLSSIGFLKYGRIYMMEMPLCLLTTYASLLFYQYLEDKSIKTLIGAILITASANLIKGPVSFVMNFGAVFLFLAYEYYQSKKISLKPYLVWTSCSVLVGSLWYLSCYLEFGSSFIDYFFLRENLGKFQSKSYPISSVINGLLIFALPWTLLLPLVFNKPLLKSFWDKKINRFLIFHFLFLFFLWMIPSQRSHHYAMPAMPFFLMILTSMVINFRNFIQDSWLQSIFKSIGALFFLFIALMSFSLIFIEIRSNFVHVLRIVVGVVALSFSTFWIIKHKDNLFKTSIASFISFSYIWILFAPIFYLPTIPSEIISKINQEQVSVIYNKPYFLSELLGKEVRVLNEVLIQADRVHPQNFYIMSQETFERHHLKDFLVKQESWRIWSRGNKLNHIFHAFTQKSLFSLQENMLLLVPKATAL